MDAKKCDACDHYYMPKDPRGAFFLKKEIKIYTLSGLPIVMVVQISPTNNSGNALDLCPTCLGDGVGQAIRSIVNASGKEIVAKNATQKEGDK